MMMNLTELFEVQRKLDAEIERKHPTAPGEDRMAKRILALQVELGELANEWRGFKFWSTDQEPRYEKTHSNGVNGEWWVTYPLLEEYVDCLHFILSIGNGIEAKSNDYTYPFVTDNTVEYQFLTLIQTVSNLNHLIRFGTKQPFDTFHIALMQFINLGKMLNFTEKMIVDAYMQKNETNWERQANGY